MSPKTCISVFSKMLTAFVFLLSLLLPPALQDADAGAGRFKRSTSFITVDNGGQWGNWTWKQICMAGTHAIGFSLKVQGSQGFRGDDTALNGIRLYCSTLNSNLQTHMIESGSGPWGSWTADVWCPDGYLTAFQLKVEPYAWYRDNTAANNLKFRCSTGQIVEGDGGSWGEFGSWSQSCSGVGICGLKTRIQEPQGSGDDTALNDVRFYCCN
ncbi:vitelline membrane outer layer protein 1 homolog [Latimeria chalumnae]|uniref:vitelline membrane outer layer protein 1 homolog n=1 Tax=Latimeria chalumnae TaxID=7897 RepID=UPI00313DDC89